MTKFQFKSVTVAGIFMAMMATKFGLQSELHTMSNHYEVVIYEIDKHMVTNVQFYAAGLSDGISAIKEAK